MCIGGICKVKDFHDSLCKLSTVKTIADNNTCCQTIVREKID